MNLRRALPIMALLISACAQVRDPSGGEKDTQPPQLLGAEPPSGTTGFTGDRITLRFNERVRLDRVSEKVLISPPLREKPDIRMSGADDVVIELKAPLEANTTYLFNIGDAVLDLSEGNAAGGPAYVLSTGDHIDSLLIRGEVMNAFTAKPEKDILVLAYAGRNDTGFTLGAPDYFTRTSENGRFTLDHLRSGAYSLFALRDQNASYRYDLPNEEVAFLMGTVEASVLDSTGVPLRTFRETAPVQQLLAARATADGALRVTLARPAENLAVTSIGWTGGMLGWQQERNATGDTILLWPSDTTLLEGRSFQLSDNGSVLDTIVYERHEKMPYYVVVTLAWEVTGGTTSYALHTSRPVAAIDATRITAQRPDGEGVAIVAAMDSGAVARIIRLSPEDRQAQDLSLLLLPGAIRDAYGGTHDTLRFHLRPAGATETGDLKLRVVRATPTRRTLLQLLGAQDQVVRETPLGATEEKIEWALVPPGTYGLKLLDDVDGNGRWSTGDLIAGKEPERTWRYDGTISVRAGWDVDVEWKIAP